MRQTTTIRPSHNCVVSIVDLTGGVTVLMASASVTENEAVSVRRPGRKRRYVGELCGLVQRSRIRGGRARERGEPYELCERAGSSRSERRAVHVVKARAADAPHSSNRHPTGLPDTERSDYARVRRRLRRWVNISNTLAIWQLELGGEAASVSPTRMKSSPSAKSRASSD